MNEGKKLFRFVKAILPGLKNSEIFKLIRKKIVTVNNRKTDHINIPKISITELELILNNAPINNYQILNDNSGLWILFKK